MGRKKKIPEGLGHVQRLTVDRELTKTERAELGNLLATEELQLVQVRKEAKESAAEYNGQIKGHAKEINRLATAIDTGIITEEVECNVLLDRDRGKKLCTPVDGGKTFEMDMTDDDYTLLT